MTAQEKVEFALEWYLSNRCDNLSEGAWEMLADLQEKNDAMYDQIIRLWTQDFYAMVGQAYIELLDKQ